MYYCGGGLGVIFPWMGVAGLGLSLLLSVGLIVLAVWAVRMFHARQSHAPDSALDILARRFATGEIGQAEYQQAKCVLQG